MFIIENYGFFIFLIVIILIIFYFQNGQCFDLRKNIREGFDNFKENFSNGSNINISPINYLDSGKRMKKKDTKHHLIVITKDIYQTNYKRH